MIKRKKKIQIPPKALSEVLNDGNEVELLKSEVETAISQQKELTDTQESFALSIYLNLLRLIIIMN